MGEVTKFTNCFVLRHHQIIKEDILVRDGKFLDPEPLFFDERRKPDRVIDCQGLLLAPGLIDLQINGGFGVDFSHDIRDQEQAQLCLEKVAKGLVTYGVTSFCPTLVTSPKEAYHKIIPFVKKTKGGPKGAEILGLHLEGPFISPEKKGAHPIECIRQLPNGFKDVTEMYGDLENVSIITLAPELDGEDNAVIKECSQRGIAISLGHSAATLKQAEAAVRAGARLITHLFNAMTVFHHRADPGIMGLMTSKRIDNKPIFYGLIADGIHTHPTALRMAVRSNIRGLVAVSDAIGAMGLSDGRYNLGQYEIEVKGPRAVIAGTETLCGASATVYDAVRNLVHLAECSIVEALESATLHPAQALGIEKVKGTLDFGADADFILVDKDSLDLVSTWIGGQCVYEKK